MKISLEKIKEMGACVDAVQEFLHSQWGESEVDVITLLKEMVIRYDATRYDNEVHYKGYYLKWGEWLLAKVMNQKQLILYKIHLAEELKKELDVKYPNREKRIRRIETTIRIAWDSLRTADRRAAVFKVMRTELTESADMLHDYWCEKEPSYISYGDKVIDAYESADVVEKALADFVNKSYKLAYAAAKCAYEDAYYVISGITSAFRKKMLEFGIKILEREAK